VGRNCGLCPGTDYAKKDIVYNNIMENNIFDSFYVFFT
jgi:hypothetical protein